MAPHSFVSFLCVLLGIGGWMAVDSAAQIAEAAPCNRPPGSEHVEIHGEVSPGTLVLGAEQAVLAEACSSGPADASFETRDSDLDALCVRQAIGSAADPFAYCDLPPTATPAIPTVTPGLVARAFRNVPLPAAELRVQPPNGRTLVNLETNFFTEQGSFIRQVRLLGQRVELEVWPSRFRWVFGDGRSQSGASPGAPYPHLDITHEYARRGRVSPRVDTTYAARYRVGGGTWRDVDGTVTIPGSPVPLRVMTAKPVLTGYR